MSYIFPHCKQANIGKNTGNLFLSYYKHNSIILSSIQIYKYTREYINMSQ